MAAKTAVGKLDASMLDTATTISMTNNMKMLELSSAPTMRISMNIHANP